MVHTEAQEVDSSLAEIEAEVETAKRSVLGEFWHYFSENKGAVMPLDLDAEVKRWGAAGAARA